MDDDNDDCSNTVNDEIINKQKSQKNHVVDVRFPGFVYHLENLEFLEFWDFSFQAWDSLKNGAF